MGRLDHKNQYSELETESLRRADKIARIQRFIARGGAGNDPFPELDQIEELFVEQ